MRAVVKAEYFESIFAGADVVLTPVIPIPVPSIAGTTTDDPAKVGQRLGALTHCVRGVNYLGLPAMVVLIGFCGEQYAICD